MCDSSCLAPTPPQRETWVEGYYDILAPHAKALLDYTAPCSFPEKNRKKLAFFFIFILSSFFKKKQFLITAPWKRSFTLQNGK